VVFSHNKRGAQRFELTRGANQSTLRRVQLVEKTRSRRSRPTILFGTALQKEILPRLEVVSLRVTMNQPPCVMKCIGRRAEMNMSAVDLFVADTK